MFGAEAATRKLMQIIREREIPKMLIQTMTGFENFQRSGAKAYVYVVPCQEFSGHEAAIGQAARDSVGCPIAAHGPRNRIQAAPGLTDDFGGWASAAYEIPAGMILKLFASRKSTNMTAGRHMNASLLVRLREGAPLIRVWVGLTGDERAQFSRVNVIEGRMDVLTLAEGERFGVQIRRQFQSQFGADNVALMFNVETIDTGTAAPVVDTRERINEAGETVTVAATRRRRALDL